MFVMTAAFMGPGAGLVTTAGMSFSAVRGLFVPTAATIPGGARRISLCQKLFPAVRAAKVKYPTIACGTECRRFVHCHSANGILCHRHEVFTGLKLFGRGIAHGISTRLSASVVLLTNRLPGDPPLKTLRRCVRAPLSTPLHLLILLGLLFGMTRELRASAPVLRFSFIALAHLFPVPRINTNSSLT